MSSDCRLLRPLKRVERRPSAGIPSEGDGIAGLPSNVRGGVARGAHGGGVSTPQPAARRARLSGKREIVCTVGYLGVIDAIDGALCIANKWFIVKMFSSMSASSWASARPTAPTSRHRGSVGDDDGASRDVVPDKGRRSRSSSGEACCATGRGPWPVSMWRFCGSQAVTFWSPAYSECHATSCVYAADGSLPERTKSRTIVYSREAPTMVSVRSQCGRSESDAPRRRLASRAVLRQGLVNPPVECA